MRLQPRRSWWPSAALSCRGEIKARFGADVDAFRDAQQLLAEAKPDIVHIVTPPQTHFELARLCLEGGANVYVEKPFALASDQASEILDLAQRKGLRTCAAHQVLFQRAGQRYQTFLPVIGDPFIRKLFFVQAVRRRPMEDRPCQWSISSSTSCRPVYLLLMMRSRTVPVRR